MTTSVSIINHGPDRVTVAPINDNGEALEVARVTLAPSERVDFVVYDDRNVHIAEVKRAVVNEAVNQAAPAVTAAPPATESVDDAL